MIRAASPATKPDLIPGTLERFDRLENTTSRGKPWRPSRCAASSAPSGGGRRRSRAPSSTRRRRSRSRGGPKARRARATRRASSPGRWGCPASTRRRSWVRAPESPPGPRRSRFRTPALDTALAYTGSGAGEQRRALVDLIERVGADHDRVARAVDTPARSRTALRREPFTGRTCVAGSTPAGRSAVRATRRSPRGAVGSPAVAG